jgi:23S rRNA maturation-related 3'-5' exoribonuclease YhaM
MILTVDNAMEYLGGVSSTLYRSSVGVVRERLSDPRFAVCPASEKHRHNYLGGLALHTAEVVQNCLKLCGARYVPPQIPVWGADTLPPSMEYLGGLDLDCILVAAFLHDYCKIYEYDFELEDVPKEEVSESHEAAFSGGEIPWPRRIKPGSIKSLPYARLTGHIVGIHTLLNSYNVGPQYEWIDSVSHCILSHHGRKEWGSPVEPKTPEAWILHAADMLSANPL